MSYQAGSPYAKAFVIASPTTGAALDADSLPVATANKNGTDDPGFALTIVNIDTGRYTVSGTIPVGYVSGDVLNVSVAATVGGIAAKAIIDTQVMATSLTAAQVNTEVDTALADVGLTTTRVSYLDNVNNATLQTAVFPTDPADQSLLIAAIQATQTAVAALDALLQAGVSLTPTELTALADATLGRTLGTESYAADGAVPTLSEMLFMLLSSLTQFGIVGTTLTTKKLDGTTTALVYTLDSATSPTQRLRTG